MRKGFIPVTVCSFSLVLMSASGQRTQAFAQSIGYQSPLGFQQLAQAPQAYQPQQLDQLLAPIALYPDPLLAQVLMASTYPLEVVEAARWMQQGNNASLTGAQLEGALSAMDWDPSVKSLAPFPQVLQMMNANLEWTEALGNAFVAQQADVTTSVQRLRQQAMAAQTLQTTAQETIFIQGGMVLIEPTNPQIVYVPYYDPALVYGRWAYPDYPPVYFPPSPRYGFVTGPGIYFGLGFGIVQALWGWNRWDWDRHSITIDPDRYNQMRRHEIDHDNHPRYTESYWRHDPSHRRGVAYGAPVMRQNYQPHYQPQAPSAAPPAASSTHQEGRAPSSQDRRPPDHPSPRQEVQPQQNQPQRQPELQHRDEPQHEQRQQYEGPADNGPRDSGPRGESGPRDDDAGRQHR